MTWEKDTPARSNTLPPLSTRLSPPPPPGIRVLEIRAEREDRALHGNARDRARGVATREAIDGRRAAGAARDRIVDPARDLALADQEGIRDAAQRRERVAVFERDRFVGTVGTGRDDGARRTRVEQEVVQRSVGQHDTEFAVVGRDAGKRNARIGEHDRPRYRCQESLARGIERCKVSRGCEITRHEREWPLLAVLAVT